MVNQSVGIMQAELQNDATTAGDKNGVCLEFLKGTCDKGPACPFSHSLQEYYFQVCKKQPFVSVSKQSVPESLRTCVGHEGPMGQESSHLCKRLYVLQCVIPVLFPGQPKRAEAFIAALVLLLLVVNVFFCLTLAVCFFLAVNLSRKRIWSTNGNAPSLYSCDQCVWRF